MPLPYHQTLKGSPQPFSNIHVRRNYCHYGILFSADKPWNRASGSYVAGSPVTSLSTPPGNGSYVQLSDEDEALAGRDIVSAAGRDISCAPCTCSI